MNLGRRFFKNWEESWELSSESRTSPHLIHHSIHMSLANFLKLLIAQRCSYPIFDVCSSETISVSHSTQVLQLGEFLRVLDSLINFWCDTVIFLALSGPVSILGEAHTELFEANHLYYVSGFFSSIRVTVTKITGIKTKITIIVIVTNIPYNRPT